jgi:alkylation response protein AidB-like acyl-CoA dehydrogenase
LCPALLLRRLLYWIASAPELFVGEVGQGYKIAIEILNEGRIGIAAQMLGIAEGAYESAMPYLFQRKQFNQVGVCTLPYIFFGADVKSERCVVNQMNSVL